MTQGTRNPKTMATERYAWLFYVAVFGIFWVLVSPYILGERMFMDGLYYATISRNLAHGLGSFWNPHFTLTLFPAFHEHPPLAFGLESLFFRVLGDSIYVEKLYSLLTLAVLSGVVVSLWQTISRQRHYGWMPLLLLISVPVVGWGVCNNMLENTLTIFTAASVLFFFKGESASRWVYFFVAGVMLSLGFLTKGFVAFFPLSLPFIYWMMMRNKSFGKMTAETAIMVAAAVVPLGVLCAVFPVAKESLWQYFQQQVVKSVMTLATVDSRYYILGQVFLESLPMLLLAAIVLGISRLKGVIKEIGRSQIRLSMVFLLLGMTGVVPIMISMKQSGFYIIATFPMFALGLSVLLYPVVHHFFLKIHFTSKVLRWFRSMVFAILIIGIGLSLYLSNHYTRDYEQIQDSKMILKEIPENSTINICNELYKNWGVRAYFARMKNVSLDDNMNHKHDFFLIKTAACFDTLAGDYVRVDLKTTKFKLYRRN